MNALHRLSIPAAAIWLSACDPVNPPPAGYVDACYGGKKYLIEGSVPEVTIRVLAPENKWRDLAALMSEFGKSEKLEVFDTSQAAPHVRTLEVSLCSSRGLMIYTNERIWREGSREPDGDAVVTYVYRYKNEILWREIAERLVTHVQSNWPGEVRVEWREAQPV
jgi:hypothetical protein